MKRIRLIISLILTNLFILFLLFFTFLWWNNTSPLHKKSNPAISTLKINNDPKDNYQKIIKIVSYNIHFGIGLNIQTDEIDKNSYLKRLNKIAKILQDINADIVLLQEVDFFSKRSFFIDQHKYLAMKSGYKYIAKAPTLRKKIHFFFNKVIGKIEHGLSILSKYPIEFNEAYIFDISKEIPFYMNWLYDPHGAQKCIVDIKGKKINIINVHLDPWSQYIREEQMTTIKNLWLKDKKPTILGGDFNALSPTAIKKKGLYQLDAPWFIDKKSWDIKNEQTINILISLGYKEAAATKLSIKTNNFTYPSNNPKEKIDHIFASNEIKIIQGYIYKDAKIASDHLPIIAEIKLKKN